MRSKAHRYTVENFLLALFFLCSGGFAPKAFAADPLAILTDVTGSVTVTRAGKVSKGTTGKSLQANDRVAVKSGKATIFYVTQAPRILKAGQQATVGKANNNAKSASTWRNVYAGLSSGFARHKDSKPGTVRDGETILISPVGPTFKVAPPLMISTNRPLLVWTRHKTAADYKVSLLKVTGKDTGQGSGEEFWSRITPNTTFLYNGDITLQPGVIYKWQITPRNGDLVEIDPAPSVPFTVASPATIQTIKQNRQTILNALANAPEETRREAVAAMLIQNKFYADAIAVLAPEMLKPKFLNAAHLSGEFENILKGMRSSSRKLLHNAFVGTDQQQWSNLIYSPPPVPDKAGATNSGATNSGATNSGATNSGATNSGATNSGATGSVNRKQKVAAP